MPDSTPMLVLVLVLVLGEVITPWQWAGTALVVVALACVMPGGLVKRR